MCVSSNYRREYLFLHIYFPLYSSFMRIWEHPRFVGGERKREGERVLRFLFSTILTGTCVACGTKPTSPKCLKWPVVWHTCTPSNPTLVEVSLQKYVGCPYRDGTAEWVVWLSPWRFTHVKRTHLVPHQDKKLRRNGVYWTGVYTCVWKKWGQKTLCLKKSQNFETGICPQHNYSINQILWSIFHLNDLKTLFSLTKILMKCHFKAMYIYYLFSMREKVVTKSTIFMKKNRFWKPYPTLLIIWSFFESCFYGIKMCVSHTWPTWLSTLSNHFCLVIFICIHKFHL